MCRRDQPARNEEASPVRPLVEPMLAELLRAIVVPAVRTHRMALGEPAVPDAARASGEAVGRRELCDARRAPSAVRELHVVVRELRKAIGEFCTALRDNWTLLVTRLLMGGLFR